jgi:membrane protease YdiL (CAAX protease family)
VINTVVLGSAGVLTPGRLRWLRALLWAALLFSIVLFLLGAILVAGVAVSAGVHPLRYMDAPAHILLGWSVACALASLGTYAGLVWLAERRVPVELDLKPALLETAAGLAIGAAMMASVVGLMWLFGAITITSQPVGSPIRAIALSIQSGVMEEVAFRLIALRLLWRAFGLKVALILSALLFGVLHIYNPNSSWFAAVCIAVEAGVMLAGFYILTGRIWTAIGVHAGWNFTQGWLFGAAVSGTSSFEGGPWNVEPVGGISEILSGGGFGPEASAAGLLIGTAAGGLTLWLAWKKGRLSVREQSEITAAIFETD